jgi:hypothetical protein
MYFRARVVLLLPDDRKSRSPQTRRFDMKIPTIMMVAGAAIVFAAPVASAHMTTYDRTLPQHKIVKHHKVTTHVKTSTAKTAPTIKTAPRPPLYIYVPGFTGTPSVSPSTNDCESSMVDCTDQQLCEYWGMNCSTGGDQSSPAQAEPVTTTSTSEVVASSSQLADDSQSASQTSSAASDQDSSDDC